MATKRVSARQVLSAGPWKGVRDTVDPFDDNDDLLVDATNIYIPDPQGGSAVYARPGFALGNARNPVFTSGSPFRGQAVYTHIAVDGTTFNFIVYGGHLFRVNATLTTFTDVTPVGATISAAITARVKFVSLGDDLIVSDGVNRPWIATNLAATPITGTNINYDGAAVAWAAQDITVWGGAIVVALKSVAGVARQSDIAWSEPGTPAIGWQQTDFDNNWTLEQTGSSPIYAVVGTNVALYYFRSHAIGAIAGAIGPNLQTTSTHDAVSFNVGTEGPQSIQTFGNTIYFCDNLGRPWSMPLGGIPVAIWLNMRAIVDAQTTGFPLTTAITITTVFEPVLNLYLAAIWSPEPARQASPIEMYAFDARTGAYVGRWFIGGDEFGVSLDCVGVFLGTAGETTLVVLGSAAAGGTTGYVWSFNSLTATTTHLATEGLPIILTTQGGELLTTEAATTVWTDDGELPFITATTHRMGYSADSVWNVDRCTVITGSPSPVTITMQTPTTNASLEGTASPGHSSDGTYRIVCGAQVVGRGIQVIVQPTTAGGQWSLDRVQIVAVPSTARPEDA